MSAPEPTSFAPEVGRAIPTSTVRLVIAVVLLGLCFGIVGIQPLLAVAAFLALASIVFPKTPAIWLLAAGLAVFALSPVGSAPGWKFFVVLASAHLLHVFGMTLGWLPTGGRVQVRVLGRLLRTFVVIQVPVQLISLVVLELLAGQSVAITLTSPVFGLVGGVCFVLLVVFVVVPSVASRAASRNATE